MIYQYDALIGATSYRCGDGTFDNKTCMVAFEQSSLIYNTDAAEICGG